MNIILICRRCNHDILPGQLFQLDRGHMAPSHVACPSEREIQIAHRWGRWA